MSVNRIYPGYLAWRRQLRHEETAGAIPDGDLLPIRNHFDNLKTSFIWKTTSEVISCKMTVQGGACTGNV